MQDRIAIVIALTFMGLISNGQQIEFNTKSFYGAWNSQGTEYYYGGGGAELTYEHPLIVGSLRAGLELRSVNWGNQATLNMGHKHFYSSSEKWSLGGIGSLGLGTALFYDNPLFVWSADYSGVFTYFRNKRTSLNIGFGVRYTHCPAYKDYGQINQLFEFPLQLGISYSLKKKTLTAE